LGVGQVQRSVIVTRWRMQVIEHGETSEVRLANRLMVRRRVITVSFCIVLAATTAMAQQSGGTVTETVTTRRDLNGRDVVNEKVVMHSSRTNGEERVVIETYSPSMEAGRLALSQRVNRVTTLTKDGSQTVEETEEPSRVSPGDPPRVVRRSVTTMRRSGSDSYVSDRQAFELDVNGRLVFVHKQSERGPRN
jgi:hypothetical protein